MNCLLGRLRGRCPFTDICEKEERLLQLKAWLNELKEKKRLLLKAIDHKENLALLAQRQDYDIGLIEKKQQIIGTASSEQLASSSRESPSQCPYKGNCEEKSELLSLRIRAMNRQCFALLNSYNQICQLLNTCISFHKQYGIKAQEVFLALDTCHGDKLMYCLYPTGRDYRFQKLPIQLFKRELEGKIGHIGLWLQLLSASEHSMQVLGKKGMIIELIPEKQVSLEEFIFLLEKIEQLLEHLVYLKSMGQVSLIYIARSAVKVEKRQLMRQLKKDPWLKTIGQIRANGCYMEEQLLVSVRNEYPTNRMLGI